MTKSYRNVIDRFIDEKLTSDDILLEKKISHFYKTKMDSDIQAIIDYLRSKSISNLSLELANELEKLMKPKESVNATAIPESLSSSIPANQTETAYTRELKQDDIFLIEPGADVKIHELAAIFPRLGGLEFDQLKSSIATGQQTPVIMYGDLLLDGRNRINACWELGIPAKAVQWCGAGTAEELILGLNLHRRHLTTSQRSGIAVKLLPALEQQAAERMKAGKSGPREKNLQGKATDVAGAQVGISGKSVAKAKKIAEASAATYQELLSGKLTLAQAAKEIKAVDAPESQPESKRLTALEVIEKIVGLMHGQFTDEVLAIAEDATQSVRKTIRSCFIFDAPDTSIASEAEEEDTGITQPDFDI
jgi:hypothetical protein